MEVPVVEAVVAECRHRCFFNWSPEQGRSGASTFWVMPRHSSFIYAEDVDKNGKVVAHKKSAAFNSNHFA